MFVFRGPLVTMLQLRPVILSGPSGSGKSTLLKMLMSRHPDCFAFTVSHTTRKPRPGEVDGTDYHFVSRDVMETEISRGEFLEHAEFSGNMYGTSTKAVEEVMASGRICMLDIDMQGVRNVRKIPDFKARFISIRPPQISDLETRLRGRGTETEDKIKARLAKASAELEFAQEPGVFDLSVVNDVPERAVSELEGYLFEDLAAVKKNLYSAFPTPSK